MKLYYSPGACSLAPHIVLRELGIAFELVRVDIPTKKTEHGEDYWKINPKGYVPALVLDNREILTEVPVICLYLADQIPGYSLAPQPGTMPRYHLMEWLNFVATEVHKQIGALFNPKMTPDMKKVQLGVIERRLNALETMLGPRDYLMGERFSIADAYLFTVLNWTKIHKIDMAKWPKLNAYIGRIIDRPKVKEAIKVESRNK